MAMEELDEFEVLWPEPETCHTHEPPSPSRSSSPVPVQAAQASETPAASARSRPVDVPGRPKAARCSWRWNGHGPRDDHGDHDDDGGNGSAIVPPHLLLTDGWRRSEAEATEAAAWTVRASVGLGPPCKRARDLRRLRDSVLRMTGFIEG